MFVQVKLLNNFPEPLIYKVPSSWDCPVGTLVRVPLRNAFVSALIIKKLPSAPANIKFTIKEIADREPFPCDNSYFTFITQLAYYYQVKHWHFIERIAHFLTKKKPKRSSAQISTQKTGKKKNPVTLTDEQQKVVDFISPYIHTPSFVPTLLHGVTGSGKTEVYKKLIETAIGKHKSVLLLLPEVTLALQFEQLMQQQLSESITIMSFHSATSTKNKRLLWQKLIAQEPLLIIGVHLPILTPIANLGLIIIDEEHEVGYQEKKHPKIHTKEAALLRAKIANIPILLGSATPSVTSLYNIKAHNWQFFQLKKRFAGALPTIETVLLTDKQRRAHFWVSKKLQDAIAQRLAKKEQVILFINRRGFSFFVQCKLCSFIFSCSRCSVSLTLHSNNTLSCHYCGIQQALPSECPKCKTDQHNFLKKGIGTQQVVSIIASLFPHARIARADLDTSTKKNLWRETVKEFHAGNIDILVGTQTITKGYHFPRVTLVGIIWADLNLHFPVYNASETTLQQLIQVAGRAGREHAGSTVIVQTMAHYQVFNYLNEIDYIQYYDDEIKLRESAHYPPHGRLAQIELKHKDEAVLEREALSLAHTLRARINIQHNSVTLLGPAKPPVHTIKGISTRVIYLKSPDIKPLLALFSGINKQAYKSNIYFTPNPLR